MVPIGTELICSEIVYTLPKLERIEYAATTYACPECKDTEELQFIKDNVRPALIADDLSGRRTLRTLQPPMPFT